MVAFGRTRKRTRARFAGHERRVDGLYGHGMCGHGRFEGFRVRLCRFWCSFVLAPQGEGVGVAYGRTRKFTKARFAGHERRVDGL